MITPGDVTNRDYLEIVPGHLISAGHPSQGEEHQGKQRGDGQRQQLKYPVDGHHLQREGEMTEDDLG